MTFNNKQLHSCKQVQAKVSKAESIINEILYHNSAKIIILCMLCIFQLQPYLLTMVSKSSTGIIIISTTKSHAISTKYCSWQEGTRYTIHFIYIQSYPYICCSALCDRYSIILTSSIYRRMLIQKKQ